MRQRWKGWASLEIGGNFSYFCRGIPAATIASAKRFKGSVHAGVISFNLLHMLVYSIRFCFTFIISLRCLGSSFSWRKWCPTRDRPGRIFVRLGYRLVYPIRVSDAAQNDVRDPDRCRLPCELSCQRLMYSDQSECTAEVWPWIQCLILPFVVKSQFFELLILLPPIMFPPRVVWDANSEKMWFIICLYLSYLETFSICVLHLQLGYRNVASGRSAQGRKITSISEIYATFGIISFSFFFCKWCTAQFFTSLHRIK